MTFMGGRSTYRKLGFAAAVCSGALLIPAAAAFACLSVANVQANPATIQAGGQVNLIGMEFGSTTDIQVHLGAIAGPVIATISPGTVPGANNGGNFTAAVTIPADTPTGPQVLVLTQAAGKNANGTISTTSGTPARVVVQVVGAGGSAPLAVTPSGSVRPSGIVTTTSSVSSGALVLVGVGVFGAALFLAGGIALMTSGRRREASAERVRS